MLKSLLIKFINFIKKRLQHRPFPVNIAKFLRTAICEEHLRMTAFEYLRNSLYPLAGELLLAER